MGSESEGGKFHFYINSFLVHNIVLHIGGTVGARNFYRRFYKRVSRMIAEHGGPLDDLNNLKFYDTPAAVAVSNRWRYFMCVCYESFVLITFSCFSTHAYTSHMTRNSMQRLRDCVSEYSVLHRLINSLLTVERTLEVMLSSLISISLQRATIFHEQPLLSTQLSAV